MSEAAHTSAVNNAFLEVSVLPAQRVKTSTACSHNRAALCRSPLSPFLSRTLVAFV